MSVHGNLQPLSWESEFFGLQTAKLQLASEAPLITEAMLACHALVQAKVPAANVAQLDALSQLGFQFVEGEMDCCLAITAQDGLPAVPQRWRVANTDSLDSVRDIARGAFSLSRFRSPWYQPGDSGRFYTLWAEKAILGTFDTHCLVIQGTDAQPLGFVTLRSIAPGEARIGLLAVRPDSTGQGVGKKLMIAARQWCAQQAISRLYVATQSSNIAALNLYLASGAKLVSSAYWLYR
ncbi:dTDP-4-amino-4,6-dideoxy-D-galactose acyltransferase [Rouxiella sp. Mn2063]|uniref:dTDP-4-amino-4,6-dideoxy-D-galactose acyltransferase n=1 Tax=Rouxiella sp. Mn2063 TaxID=3395262 RepID=UPI003BE04115